MDGQDIVRGFKATLLARAVYMVSSALLMVALARYLLEPEGYGTLYWTIGVLAVVQLFADVGLGKSAARYFAEYREKDPGQIPHLVRSSAWYKFVLGAVVAVGLFLLADPLASLLGDPNAAPFLAAGALYVFAKTFHGFAMIGFQGFNDLVYSATVQASAGVVRLVFAVGFVLLGFGALGALFGYIVGYAVAGAVGMILLYRSVYGRYHPAKRYEPGLSRRLLEYSVPLMATQSANVIDKQIDVVLVGVFLNPTAVAFYTLGKQVTDFVLAPAESLGFTISPNFGEHKAAGRLERARSIYEAALTNVLALYVPAAAGLALVADPFVTMVFGPDYAGAVVVLQLLSGFIVLGAINNLTSDGLDYLGRARHRAVVKGATSVANFALNVALIPVIGVAGAAIATVATHTVYVLVNLWIVHGELALNVGSLLRTTGLVCAITGVMAAAVVLVVPMVSSPLTLVGVIALGVATWAVLAVASGLVDPREVRTVLS
ncbi:flippase [Natrialbaceae archaeon GCM10025810]|uniref:flippase n=1 Tax=Halovalidus salilacus TaxID=3075124 RepID=UPI003605F6D5